MANVDLPLIYTDGATFLVAGHNRNLYSTKPPEGIYSELNGGIDSANVTGAFAVATEHIQDEQVTFARSGGGISTIDNMGNANLDSPVDSGQQMLKVQALPGCSLRVYIPFAASVVEWEVSFFFHCWRFKSPDVLQVTPSTPHIATKVVVNGVVQDYLRRRYPPTVFQNNNTEDFINDTSHASRWKVNSTETATSQQLDLEHMEQNAALGWHEMALTFHVGIRETDVDSIYLDTVRNYNDRKVLSSKTLYLQHRFTVGCRSARVIAYR